MKRSTETPLFNGNGKGLAGGNRRFDDDRLLNGRYLHREDNVPTFTVGESGMEAEGTRWTLGATTAF